MTAIILDDAEDDLERAFDYYQHEQTGLGVEFVDEFRRGLERILQHPHAWQPLDDIYRRYRLHRFPYGIVYRVDNSTNQIVIVTVMHLSQRPGQWRGRDRRV
jgi:plasmid stabilization system protein ParE